MIPELKRFALKVLVLAIAAPLLASALLFIIEKIEKAWKSGNRRKKWLALTMLMVFFGIVMGWLS